jgi:protocatechuate 3,4-dioxygenase beta subunit
MVSSFDLSETIEEWALAYEFDIVLRGPDASVFEDHEDAG